MIRHFTVSDRRMTISANRCVESALQFGCDESHAYLVPDDIQESTYLRNKELFDSERGAGYWAWKSYFMVYEILENQDADYIIYTDAGVDFVNDVNLLLNEMEGDIMLFGNGWYHVEWCKADVLKAMGVPLDYQGDQAQASCVIVKPTINALKFIQEWFKWGTKDGMIDDSPSVIPNVGGFREHRHDQAILTNLAIKYNIPFNRWPAQYKLRGNEKYTNMYPQIFNHHRKRNEDY